MMKDKLTTSKNYFKREQISTFLSVQVYNHMLSTFQKHQIIKTPLDQDSVKLKFIGQVICFPNKNFRKKKKMISNKIFNY